MVESDDISAEILKLMDKIGINILTTLLTIISDTQMILMNGYKINTHIYYST